MKVDMAEKLAIEKLEEQDFASEVGKQESSQEIADAKLFQESNNALQELDEELLDQDSPDFEQMYYDVAEEADDELDSDNDYEEIQPLNIKKTKTGKDVDQVHLSTNSSEQTAKITAHTHGHVEWVDNLAQAQKNSPQASHTARIALERNLPRAPSPYSEPLSVHHVSDLLHPSPPLRRRKGSRALKAKFSDSGTTHTMMPKKGKTQDASYDDHDQGHTAEHSQDSDTHLTPTHRGKVPEARGNQNASPGEDQGNTADIFQNSEASTSSGNRVLKHKTSGFPKADAVLGYGEKDVIAPSKSMTNLAASPKASHEKKSLHKLFHRKGSKESTTPPSSGKTASRKTISTPTLLHASPNAKALLDSAHSLVDASPNAKNVVNYSRPIVHHSSSEASNGSPVVPGRSSFALHGPNAVPDLSTNPEGPADKSGYAPVGLNTSLIHENPYASAVRGNQGAVKHGAIPETLATEKNPDASDSDSFNPSDYSGDENSVHQAVSMPIVYRGRAKLVDVRPPRGINAAAPRYRPGVPIAQAPVTASLSDDDDAEMLGAQDAERYYNNAMPAETSPTADTDDPFIDPAYRKLLAKPANDISAKEMARLKDARKAGNMGGGLTEKMTALLPKNDAKPMVENTGDATTGTRSNTGGSLMSKMRVFGKKSKKGKEQEDSEEEVVSKVETAQELGLRQEKEIHERIKASLAAKDAANGGVRGAGFPRIDYGPPSLRTALGGSSPTDEDRAHARTLETRRAAGPNPGRAQNDGDNTTARGQFEGY